MLCMLVFKSFFLNIINVFSSFLNLSIFSVVLISIGSAFQYLEPLYSKIRLPYFVLKLGVSRNIVVPFRRFVFLRVRFTDEHCPLSTLNTISITL